MEPRPNNVPLWPCKDKVVKSQFSSYLSSFSVSRDWSSEDGSVPLPGLHAASHVSKDDLQAPGSALRTIINLSSCSGFYKHVKMTAHISG